ncbi:MAG: hypothetical protein M3O70_12065 [Actinomycetota bacterium]|nr:hypothetical protein [Actinomycetota bacterium]
MASPFDVPGRLYLLGGPEGPFHMDLYLDDGDRLRQITTEATVSWMSASDGQVVVAAASDRTESASVETNLVTFASTRWLREVRFVEC